MTLAPPLARSSYQVGIPPASHCPAAEGQPALDALSPTLGNKRSDDLLQFSLKPLL